MAAIVTLLGLFLIALATCTRDTLHLAGRVVRRLAANVTRKVRALRRGDVLPAARALKAPPKTLQAP